MGVADRWYMHEYGCTCPKCREAYERDKQEREIEIRSAAEKYKRDKEFGDNLRKMLRQYTRCKHSRPLSDGERWEDTFCNLLCVPCHLVQHGNCASEELMSIVKEETKNPDQINGEVNNEEDTYNNTSSRTLELRELSESTELEKSQNVGVKCPICGSETTLRTAKKGPNAGKKFHVCINYPHCEGKVVLDEEWGSDW